MPPNRERRHGRAFESVGYTVCDCCGRATIPPQELRDNGRRQICRDGYWCQRPGPDHVAHYAPPHCPDCIWDRCAPPPRKGRAWTPEQKAIQSEKMREYWSTHTHPRQGVATRPETRERMREAFEKREVKAQCLKCGLPLWNDDSVKLGLGPACFQLAFEAGEIVMRDGEYAYAPFASVADAS